MNYINELVELAQQLDSVMDDSRSVFSMNINSTSGRVGFLADPKYIIENFGSFDIEEKEKDDYPFKMTTEVEGVQFRAVVHIDEIDMLKDYLPAEVYNRYKNGQPKKVFRFKGSEQQNSPLARECE